MLSIFKKGGGNKNYIFKDGVFKVTPTTNQGKITNGKLVFNANYGNSTLLSIPYTKTGKNIIFKCSYYTPTTYQAALFGNGTKDMPIAYTCGPYSFPFIVGAESSTAINIKTTNYAGTTANFVLTVDEIWIEDI